MRRILIVDDNAVSRELIREVLAAPDRDIAEAGDGEAALEVFRQHEPELVLVDLHMPLLDGYGFLAQVRRFPPPHRFRIVALTASAMQGDRETALAAGFDEYLTKPIHAASLRRRVEEFLRDTLGAAAAPNAE